MIYLVIAIALHTYLFVCFKLFETFKIDTFQAIVVNYCTCVATGLFNTHYNNEVVTIDPSASWFYFALLLGAIFIGTFYIIALSAQKVGVSVTAVTAKTSMIFPILYSFFVSKQSQITFLSIIGIIASFGAVILTSLKKSKSQISNTASYLLVLSVFLGSGLVDLIINHCNSTFDFPTFKNSFSILSFGSAACFGSVYLVYLLTQKKTHINTKSFLAGIALGIPNYFSIYYILKTLSSFNNNGALVFPSINIGTILLSTAIALFFFKEPLSSKNKVGIALAIFAITVLQF